MRSGLSWCVACLCAATIARAQPPSGGEAAPTGDAAADDPHGPSAMRTDGLDDEAARSSFRIGQTLYTEGRPLEAAREFQRAYELSGRPVLMFNAYLAFRDAGQLADAVRTLDIYLREQNDVPDRNLLSGRLSAMRDTLAEQQREQEAQAQRAAELEAERERLAQEAEQHRLAAEEANARADEAEKSLNPVGFVVGGIGAAILAGGLVTGLIASGRVSEIEDNCPDNRCVYGFDLDGEADGADRLSLVTDVMVGIGAATLVTGVILLFVGRGGSRDEATPAPAAPTASCGPTGCTASMRVGF